MAVIKNNCEAKLTQKKEKKENIYIMDNKENIRCENCKFWDKFDNDEHKGICKNPKRKDGKSIHYYGFIKSNDYCTKFLRKDKR